MKIGIISDTHDRLVTIPAALALLARRGAHTLVHCGDWTKPETLEYIAGQAARYGFTQSMGVPGNNDDAEALREKNTALGHPFILPEGDLLAVHMGGVSMGVYHGHHAPTWGRIVASPEFDVLMRGHSHKPSIELLDDKLIINPGSTAFSIPRDRGPRSVGLYDTISGNAEILEFGVKP